MAAVRISLTLEKLTVYGDPYGTARLDLGKVPGRTAFFGVFPTWKRMLANGYLHIHVGWWPGCGPGPLLFSRN
jgi:hypothetical protein